MNGPIAVLAGTPVDTRMGVAYLEERGLPGVPFPLSPGPREQTAFQPSPASAVWGWRLKTMETVFSYTAMAFTV